MKTSLKNEAFKFIHQRTFVGGLLTLLVLMGYTALTTPVNSTQLIFEFGAVQWIPIIIIAVGSTFLAMEYQQQTIRTLLYKNPYKWQIYLAKLLVVWIYGVVLTAIAGLFTLGLKLLLVGHQYPWLTTVNGHHTQLVLLAGNILGTLVYTLFIVTLAFLLVMVLKINAAVIGVGLALGFLGASISVALMKTFATWATVIRWNPLNMIFVTQQLANPPHASVSHLSNAAIIGGNLLYALIFLLMGYALFKHRRV